VSSGPGWDKRESRSQVSMRATTTTSHSVASPTAETGTSAPVLEFLCLFTHDLRRKQKRWQDGRLKYHTFNRRVMAYDDRGNFIGDMHWRADWDFEAGEEIQLERGGVIVQVSDCVGQQSQDLSELVDKRIQEREQRFRDKQQHRTSTPSTRPSLPAPRDDVGFRPEQAGPTAPQVRHRPLTALIGTPTGRVGRAVVPSESPFEQRRKTDDTAADEDASRHVKRRRYEDTPPSKLGYAQSLFGTALTLSGAPPSSSRLLSQPFPKPARQRAAPQQVPPPPSPEPEASSVPAPTSFYECSTAARRSPLHAIDEQRVNSQVITTAKRRLAREALVKDSLPCPREKVRKTSNPKQRHKSKSPPQEITDLTVSDDDGAMTVAGVREQSPIVPLHDSETSNTSRLFLDRSMARNRPAAQAAMLPPVLDSGIEVDMPPVQHQAKALEESAQRTELRLKSRRKRGLLVVSEQAMAKPTGKIVEEPLPTEKTMSVRRQHHDETVRRKVDESPLNPRLMKGTGDGSLGTSTVHPDISVAQNSGQCREDEGQMYEAGDGGDEAPQVQGEGEQGLGSKVHVSVDKSRKKVRRGEAGASAHSVGEAVGQRQSESRAQRRAKKEPVQRHTAASMEQPDDSTGQYATVEATTAPPAVPRLVKLSRKSVRSKELIGFVFNDTDTGSGNGSFSVNTSDKTLSDHADIAGIAGIHGPTPITGKDTEPEPAGLVGSLSKQTALKDGPAGRTHPDPAQSVSHPSRPALWQPLAAESESAKPCPQWPPEDKGIDTTDPSETRAKGATQPGPGVIPTAHAPILPDGKLAAASQSRVREAAVETTMVQSGGARVAAITPQEPTKLVNPATRGRKAALKSHAAGQVPQPALPSDIGIQAPRSAQRDQSRDAGSMYRTVGSSTSKAPAPPKIKITFPGFVSAKGGGPWSREAHDLLETGRPS
jgi:hypothetical protein